MNRGEGREKEREGGAWRKVERKEEDGDDRFLFTYRIAMIADCQLSQCTITMLLT